MAQSPARRRRVPATPPGPSNEWFQRLVQLNSWSSTDMNFSQALVMVVKHQHELGTDSLHHALCTR
eukprot:6473819-Amphidinium_carterae.2